MADYSVDWLSVYQDFPPESIPEFGDNLILEIDSEGELQKRFLKHFHHQGSSSTSIAIRSNGTRLSVSGNPSKFCRIDNIFGLSSVDKCLAVYNKILPSLGLPELADNPQTYLAPTQYQTNENVLLCRPVLTRVDICQNYALGSSIAPFLDWASGQTFNGKSGHMYSDGNAVDWSRNSRRIYFKYYNKAAELKLHRRKQDTVKDLEYLDQLIAWCNQVGLLRFEISLKSMQLKRMGLDNPAQWSQAVMGEVIGKYASHFRIKEQQKNRPTGNPLDNCVSDLVALGVKENLAVKCEMTARAWQAGFKPADQLPKTTYYKHRSKLLLLGIDIKNRSVVRTMAPRYFDLKISEVEPPSFYRYA